MFLCFLVFSLCASAVKSLTSNSPTTTSHPRITNSTQVPVDCPHLVATPDYPVAAGLTVELLCQTTIPSQNITWSRSHLQNESWEYVGSGKVLLLTEPKQTGTYRCEIRNNGTVTCKSQNHAVYIVSISTAGEKLGEAAFAFTILILIGIIAGLGWFCWERSGNKPSSSNAPKKNVPPPPEVIPKNFPQTSDADGDIYMNYTSSTQPYTDLNPSNLTGKDFYSTLS
ncbi:uncharacterized protein LOC122846477 [Gambusia affinis]|uniref:uncharacterized protein LOC122846477 n=1 Tax=Gambusia affinis TaxID=33528 RepID=UPI001CDB8DF8|nr:uncharacterized protein LOC122846477 [Gambusia affinis]XP_043999418.1 uncharacterized protein LOC122846477 [Gambusia affinis]